MRKILNEWSLVFIFLFFGAVNVFASAAAETEIIFDDSGSMNEAKNGVVKLDMAKEALTTIAGQIPGGSSVGLRIFGSMPVTASGNVKESCQDSKLVLPISGFQKEAMIQKADENGICLVAWEKK